MGNALSGAEIAIFDQHLALGSMIGGALSVVSSFDRVVKFITVDTDDSCHASVNLVCVSKDTTSFLLVDA